jgi:hypothetical protein
VNVLLATAVAQHEIISAYSTLAAAIFAAFSSLLALYAVREMTQQRENALRPYLAVIAQGSKQGLANVGPGPALRIGGFIEWKRDGAPRPDKHRFHCISVSPGEILIPLEERTGTPIAEIEFEDVFGRIWRIEKKNRDHWECQLKKGPRDLSLLAQEGTIDAPRSQNVT